MSILQTILEKARVSAPTKKRSGKWATVRKEHLVNNPSCASCGETKKLEVHHKLPFDDDPSKELDPDNLITLCECASGGIICHLAIGHNGNYQRYNPNVEKDAAYFKEMLKNRLD